MVSLYQEAMSGSTVGFQRSQSTAGPRIVAGSCRAVPSYLPNGSHRGPSMQSLETADRKALWLPLLRRLSQRIPEWIVWKNVDSAFYGRGDIDAAAPKSAWPTIQNEFVMWAQELELTPVIICKHIPGGLNLVAAPSGLSTLLEVGVKDSKIWRGTLLFNVHDLLPLIINDPLGFRRIRPGAEGAL